MTRPPTSRADGAHAAGEIAEPEAEAASVEIRLDRAAQKRLHLAQPMVLAAGIAEVVGRVEPRGHRLGRVHRQPFVDQQLAQRRPAAGGPVVVVATASATSRRMSLALLGEV